ncbi:uncharacterized protein LOC108100760 isoform X2 [Drosophila ficusphila]|uniref:uncharacterized protein LOC108100760 isoform X2 n=1 Tax=Drosophila ficusphila TaxID=30025 RepID=UPI001C8A04A8|nr:uncharacterized protein LOC108100760 isoform X2 [Drosophila ficusphila]
MCSVNFVEAAPSSAHPQLSGDVRPDLLMARGGEPPEQSPFSRPGISAEGIVLRPKQFEEDGFDDNPGGDEFFFGFDDGSSSGNCDDLRYGPTTQAEKGSLTSICLYCVPISLFIQLLHLVICVK